MDRASVQLQVRPGMRVVALDGRQFGEVWDVFARDAEAYIAVHPRSFWRGVVEGFVPRATAPELGLLYLPAESITEVSGKRITMNMTRDAALACTSRPAWLPHGTELPPLLGRLR